MTAARLSLSLLTLAASLNANHHVTEEVNLSSADFKRLTEFEAHSIGKADKVFAKGDYKTAFAEYEAFILEYGESRAVPYAILRKGRCLQRRNKRFQAVKIYQEILDYFPNHVHFAAPAVYYIGQCHWLNGEPQKAFKAWAKMAQDKEYSKHFLAAGALNKLADNMIKLEQVAQAMKYFRQIAVNFRTSNAGAAKYARERVANYYTRQMQEEELRSLYIEVKSFEDRPQGVGSDTKKDNRYWFRVRELIQRNGHFGEVQLSQRKRYYAYWAKAMGGKFDSWDDFQFDIARFQLYANGNRDAWIKRLDDQFARHQKPGDTARIIKWIGWFKGHKSKVQEYYQKLDFGKMSFHEIRTTLETLWSHCREYTIAKACYQKFKWDRMSDKEKEHLTQTLWGKDAGLLKDTCMRFEDKPRGLSILLRFYTEGRKDAKNGLPLTDKLVGEPKYAQDAYFSRGELLHHSGRFKEAIVAYQQADNPPKNLWRVVECYKKMGDVKRAVNQLLEIENFFKRESPEAALQIGHVYKSAGLKKQCVSAYRKVLRKYRKSGQSSTAHEALEAMGERIGGGTDAEDN